MRRARLTVFALTVLAGLCGRTYAQSGQNVLIDLGPGTRAYGINASGQVTGCVSIAAGGTHAFLYAAGSLTDLGTLGGSSSCGLAINTSGQITGYTDTPADRHAFLYANGMMTDLSAVSGMPTTSGLAINSAGDVVGAAPQFGGTSVAILYSHGVVTNLFPLNQDYVGSVATVINDSGVIAGYTTGPCGILCPMYQPFTIENGVTTYLPPPPGFDGDVFDPLIAGINDAGQMVAWGEDPAGFYHGSVYSNGTPVDLGRNTTAYAINSSGEVIGNSNVARLGLGNADVGVFIYNAGATTDLNLPGVNPTGINDAGWIIANHVVLDHAYLRLPSSIGLAPTGVTFGDEPISVPSAQGTPTCGSCAVTLSNASAAAIAVDNIVATQPYSVAHSCPASLNAGATCTISVTFTPTALGPQAGALTVEAGSTTYATLLQGSGAIRMHTTAGTPAVVDQPFTIAWQAGTGATCTGSGGSWNTPVNSLPASGSKAITESVAATYTYSLTCSYGSGGKSQAQAKLVVVVQPAPSGGGGGGVDPWVLGILVTLRATRRRATARIPSAHSGWRRR